MNSPECNLPENGYNPLHYINPVELHLPESGYDPLRFISPVEFALPENARLPHAWIKLLDPERVQLPAIDSSYAVAEPQRVDAMTYSTLDLCRFDAFTILVDETSSLQFEVAAQTALARIPASVASGLLLRVIVKGVDFLLQLGQENWDGVVPLKQGQAVLVRPDQHILAVLDRDAGAAYIEEALKSYSSWEMSNTVVSNLV
ncbi:hypothetical protein AAWM_08734 [Aspergillus awamori]|uniref:Uncharacterized protein n=1 Tax=Aspergillus awamori TaxID=105351 RepID=A0A401L2W3_ASPAW|nr:hypothetical protein AAWM_08734 [Aspergillus awamori]